MVFTRVAYIPVIGEGDGEGELSQSGVEKSLYRIITSGRSFVGNRVARLGWCMAVPSQASRRQRSRYYVGVVYCLVIDRFLVGCRAGVLHLAYDNRGLLRRA